MGLNQILCGYLTIMRIFDYYMALCSQVVQLCRITRVQAIMLHKGEIMRYYAGEI